MPRPSVKRGVKPPTKPPRASSDSGTSATPPSGDVNAAVMRLIDALTALVKEVTAQLKEER